ncbi:putative sulfate exporter family transporter [Mesorhizobium sp. 1M-11]|uniref:YeiH family protein n=1 Tax=Mesorhizobium sp. 1M-11 TaxID=1529006 RepID=UPI0006C75165|nr:putative sulfate exporter family transporter [Mesorhizobium sp. 1M-11]
MSAQNIAQFHPTVPALARVLPGIGLCTFVTALAYLLQAIEIDLFGRPWLEALVFAILLGVAIRSVWTPPSAWHAGIQFSAKTLLEIAVVLLGASVSASAVLAIGPELIAGIAVVVVVAIATSYAISRALGLPQRMAILVACGNSICGNSAIAAVAPVIGADGEDVASSIAFTAVLGVIVVLVLPLFVPLLQMSLTQYGVMAGLTVYAVPQVLAATLPIGALSNQVGTVVKLVRVLMLGPVVLLMSLLASRLRDETNEPAPEPVAGDRPKPGKPAFHKLVPWFIVGFLVVAGIRTAGLIPEPALHPTAVVANLLTTISMAALGLGVDIRVVAKAGPRVTAAVTLSLIVLGLISLGLIHFIGVA